MQNNLHQYFRPAHQYSSWADALPLLKELINKAVPSKNIWQHLTKIHQLNGKPAKSRIFRNEEKQTYSLKFLNLEQPDLIIDLLSHLAEFLLQFNPNTPIELLRAGRAKTAQYDKKTIFYLVVLMFFGLVPRRSDQQEYRKFNNMQSFVHILSHSEFKTKCILEYLKTTLKQLSKQQKTEFFLVQRNQIKQSVEQMIDYNKEQKLASIKILQNTASIEDFNGQVKVDFANRFIGGGCLRNGCVQEEIMFALRPQLYALTLLCQEMQSNEAIAFTGFRRRFNSKGYANKTYYAGRCQQKYDYKLNQNEIIFDEFIVAIDALKFSKFENKQYSRQLINREIRKAVAGFVMYPKKTIVTGGWGCGVYNGDFELKLIIQWIAATIANNPLFICPFGRKEQITRTNVLQTLQDYPLAQVYKLLLTAAEQKRFTRAGIFDIIKQLLNPN